MLIERPVEGARVGRQFDQILCLAAWRHATGRRAVAFFRPSRWRSCRPVRTAPSRRHHPEHLDPGGITMPKGELAGRVLLLVDDLADTGVTLRAVDRLRGMPAILELRAAVLWVKGGPGTEYYRTCRAQYPWIHQPFRGYRQLRPDSWRSSSRFDVLSMRGMPVARPVPPSRSHHPHTTHAQRAGPAEPPRLVWCPRDSNLHAVKRWYLKLVRSPIPPGLSEKGLYHQRKTMSSSTPGLLR